jgi:predicted dienelactone hydrolase
MRPFEILFLVLGVTAAICLLTDKWSSSGKLLAALSLFVFACEVVREGAHWQMIPAYLALGVLCLGALNRRGKPLLGRQVWICVPVLLLFAASVGLSWTLPMFRLPKPTGPYPVGTTILYLKDASRPEDASGVPSQPRELVVQIWYPAAASSNRWARYREPKETNFSSSYQSEIATNSRLDAPVSNSGSPFPVILFNHGWGMRRTNDTFLTEELASHGYVVASIDHTYNARLVAFPDGRQMRSNAAHDVDDPDSSTPERVRAVWNKELAKQTADERFVLDRLEAMNLASGTPWFGRLNTHLAGAIGHSFGGAAAVELCAVDSRVHGAINMDGWFFHAIEARGANQPLLYIDTSGDYIGLPTNPNGDVGDRLSVVDTAELVASLHRYGGFVLTLKGAEHEDFTDQPLVSPLRRLSHRGAIPAPEMEAILRTYVLAFFDRTVRGQEPEALHSKASIFPEATLESWSGENMAGSSVPQIPGK